MEFTLIGFPSGKVGLSNFLVNVFLITDDLTFTNPHCVSGTRHGLSESLGPHVEEAGLNP